MHRPILIPDSLSDGANLTLTGCPSSEVTGIIPPAVVHVNSSSRLHSISTGTNSTRASIPLARAISRTLFQVTRSRTPRSGVNRTSSFTRTMLNPEPSVRCPSPSVKNWDIAPRSAASSKPWVRSPYCRLFTVGSIDPTGVLLTVRVTIAEIMATGFESR